MKIRIVVLILFGSFASTAFSQSGNPLNNWSEFLGTNMARYNPYETTLGVSNVPGLQMKWACPIGTDEISSPVVAGGVVYLQASYEDSASVVALKNGSVLWSFNEGIDTWGTRTRGGQWRGVRFRWPRIRICAGRHHRRTLVG